MDTNSLTRHLGGRKFLVSLLCLVLSSILLWFAKLDSSLYVTLNIAVLVGYITGNVVQHSNENNKT